MKGRSEVKIVTMLVLATVALLAIAGCEQASYVDRIDRATVHQYAVTSLVSGAFISTLDPPTDEEGRFVILSTAQWRAIQTVWLLDAQQWFMVDVWARQFDPKEDRPSQRAGDLAKSMVPDN